MVAYLANPFWMLTEEKLESVQLLWNTLDVIKSVYTNNDLHVAESLLELLNSFLHTFLLQVLLKRASQYAAMQNQSGAYVNKRTWVDTNRERANVREAAFELDTIRHCWERENPRA